MGENTQHCQGWFLLWWSMMHVYPKNIISHVRVVISGDPAVIIVIACYLLWWSCSVGWRLIDYTSEFRGLGTLPCRSRRSTIYISPTHCCSTVASNAATTSQSQGQRHCCGAPMSSQLMSFYVRSHVTHFSLWNGSPCLLSKHGYCGTQSLDLSHRVQNCMFQPCICQLLVQLWYCNRIATLSCFPQLCLHRRYLFCPEATFCIQLHKEGLVPLHIWLRATQLSMWRVNWTQDMLCRYAFHQQAVGKHLLQYKMHCVPGWYLQTVMIERGKLSNSHRVATSWKLIQQEKLHCAENWHIPLRNLQCHISVSCRKQNASVCIKEPCKVGPWGHSLGYIWFSLLQMLHFQSESVPFDLAIWPVESNLKLLFFHKTMWSQFCSCCACGVPTNYPLDLWSPTPFTWRV